MVARDDLVARIERATALTVTVVSASAGSGKTSLLRAWAAGPGRAHRVAFVSVGPQEQDAQVFWLALLSAVRRACGTTGDEPPAPTPEFSARELADRVQTELAGARGRVVLVIDDVHELASAEALAQLARLLGDLLPPAHVIVSTRHDVRLGLHQLRLAGELTEIRSPDLRFSESETRELLRVSKVALSEAGAALLHQRTEGWVAGLRLAALSLSGHPAPDQFVAEFSGSDHTVAEYLLAEMLERQPPDVQGLLLRTCVLDRVSGELADLLTGRPGSERILLDLEDASAFVESLDPERSWFRYHPLFAEFLRLELRRTLPADVPVLHRRASRWLAQNGEAAQAIRHAQAAGDWADGARLLADHSLSLTLDGQSQTVQALLRAFPPGADHPELALVRAMGDISLGHLDDAAAHLAVAEAHVQTTLPGRRCRLRAAIVSLQLSLARRRGQLADVIEQARFVVSPMTGPPGEDITLGSDLRAMTLLNLGTAEAWTLGPADAPDAERHLREGAVLARDIGRPYLEVGFLAQLGFASLVLHSFAATQQRCREAIELAERYGWGAEPVIAPAMIMLAGTMIWTGEFDEGERWLQRTRQALTTDTGPDMALLLHQTAGILHVGRGRHREALEELSAAEQLGSQLAGSRALASRVTRWLPATQARLGMTGEARARLSALDDEQAGSGEIRIARAVIGLAEADPAGALAAVTGILEGTVPVVGDVTLIEAHLLAALAHHELGDQRAASRATERALVLAEPDRLILPFAMTGSAELLEQLPRHETAHAALLSDILDILHGSSPAADRHTAAPPAQELSPGELRVLRYLPTNLSRPEIAGQLSVSPNTVGTHIRSIYAKLQVRDRSSAVQRARELRLITHSAGALRSPG